KGSVHLGRPWHPGGDPDASPQVLVRESHLGEHVADDPWTDMSGWPWQEARFHEYDNTGPGGGDGPQRAQISGEEAENQTPDAYLAGEDGWQPQAGPAERKGLRRRRRPFVRCAMTHPAAR